MIRRTASSSFARATIFALAVSVAVPALAWNPSLNIGGTPVRWDTTGPITWNPDGGVLGKLSNSAANAMVSAEFQKWEDVTTAVIDYSQSSQIIDPGTASATDVTSSNYSAVINASNGQNPIIYDNDRDIFDLLGTPSSVVGFAGILSASGSTINKGFAVLQGDWFDDEAQGTAPSDPGEVSETNFRGMMVHEFGHFSNLAHSSVNHELTGSGIPGCSPPNDTHKETMGPSVHSGSLTLHHDDIAGISELYPAASWNSSFAEIRGVLRDRTGSAGFVGANVILRPEPTGNTCDDRYNFSQAQQSGVSPTENGGVGSYGYPGLTATNGYVIQVTNITDGASYPITPPVSLGAPDEFYNGASEDWFNLPDDPTASTVVTAPSAGSTLGGIDIRLNNAGSPGEVEASVTAVPLSGFGPSFDLLLDDGGVNSAGAFGGTAQAAWVARFTPAAQDLPFRLERIDIMFWHPSVAVGRSIRLLVYSDTAGTGNIANATLQYTEDTTVQSISTSTFNEYTLATPFTLASGDLYVGVFDLVADAPTTFIMSYDIDSPDSRAYQQANSTTPSTYSLLTDRDWMIRARGRAEVPPGSVALTWGDACNIGTVPDQDYAVYEGALALLPTAHVSIACTTGTAAYDVLAPGSDRYWLISPKIANREGSLGTGTGGSSRTPGGPTCETVNADACP